MAVAPAIHDHVQRHVAPDLEDQAPLLSPAGAGETEAGRRSALLTSRRLRLASAGAVLLSATAVLAGTRASLWRDRTPSAERVVDLFGIASLIAEGEGNASEGNSTNATETEVPLEQIYLSNVTYALVLADVTANGDDQLSAKEGDLFIVGHQKTGGWTFGYKDQLSGYLPTNLLNLNMTYATSSYTLQDKKKRQGQLEVSVGEKVWLTAKGDWGKKWASIDKVSSNGTVLHGWVPAWSVAAPGGNGTEGENGTAGGDGNASSSKEAKDKGATQQKKGKSEKDTSKKEDKGATQQKKGKSEKDTSKKEDKKAEK